MNESGPTLTAERRPPARAGLRLQIGIALTGLMVLAFGPLFFAVASLAQATILSAGEASAAALGEAVADHVSDVDEPTAAQQVLQHALRDGVDEPTAAQQVLQHALRDGVDEPTAVQQVLQHALRDGVTAICVFPRDTPNRLCAGNVTDVRAIGAPSSKPEPWVRIASASAGRVIEVGRPRRSFVLIARVRPNIETWAPLVRLVALYMGVFALGLLTFAYFALTRLIVTPVEQLVDAADRVANGAPSLRVPRGGARELGELSTSLQAMAETLISDRSALRTKVAQLTDATTQLTQTQAQLVRSERMASVGHLAAGLAHEMGNPLAALIGLQDLLLDGDLPPETQRDFLRRMRAETERMHTVLRDMLEFARPEGERLQPEGERLRATSPQPPADVETVMADVVSLARPQAPFRAVDISVNVEGPLRVVLSAARLTQVILNMVLNAGAALASTGRGGRLSLRACAVHPNRIRIEVEDDGPGIAPAVRDRLFEPFVTTKGIGEGTGLGLAVCRCLVESVGGEVGVDPSYAAGARFYVLLPSA